MFRAFLAEDYDGIGQYVSVTLSQGASTKALKGRIASGDFGGSRFFPEGTPVVVNSVRGQLEVFLGNIPGGCTIFDDFDRTEPNPGTTSTGYLWAYQPTGGGYIQSYTNGEELVVDFTVADNTSYIWFDGSVGGVPEPLLHNKFTLTMKFRQTHAYAFAETSDIILWEWYGPSFFQTIRFAVFPSSPVGELQLDTPSSGDNVVLPAHIPGDTYVMILDYERGVHIRAKYYREDDGDPGWLTELPDIDAADITETILWQMPQQLIPGKEQHRFISSFCLLASD